MKTVRCVFGTDVGGRSYSFNVDNDNVKVGDILESKDYKSKLLVVSIEDRVYNNFDFRTGKLGEGSGVIKVLPSDTKILRKKEENEEKELF